MALHTPRRERLASSASLSSFSPSLIVKVPRFHDFFLAYLAEEKILKNPLSEALEARRSSPPMFVLSKNE